VQELADKPFLEHPRNTSKIPLLPVRRLCPPKPEGDLSGEAESEA